MPGNPSWDSFRDEIRQVVARHNELVSENPGYAASRMVLEADLVAGKHNVSVEVEPLDDHADVWLVSFDGRAAGGLGIQQTPECLSELQEVAHVDGVEVVE